MYTMAEKAKLRERVKHWLIKDKTLTTKQIAELTGAAEGFIAKVRKELRLSRSEFVVPTHKDVDVAFKKFMSGRGVTINRQNSDFNPWPKTPEDKNEKKDTTTE
jgi:hypothetical protein